MPRSTPSFATPATDRPDLFWLVADELRADALGCLSADPRAAGSFSRHTPHLDRLAASGAVFSRAYCQAPVCVASRASFLSGRYPQATGNAWFDDTPPGLPMAPERLRDAGYLTVNFGKEHHHRPASPFAVSRLRGAGDDPAYLREGDPRSLGPDFAGREAELGVIRLRATNDLIVAGTNPLPPAEAETGYLVRRAIEWLDAHRALSRRRPLLFRLSCLYPHTPVLPPRPYDALFDPDGMAFAHDAAHRDPASATAGLPAFFRDFVQRRYDTTAMTAGELRRMRAGYFGLCAYVDAELGRLLDHLGRMWDRPYLIALHSDHGTLLGEHGAHEKMNPFDAANRVPLIVAAGGPGAGRFGLAAGTRVDSPVELIDVPATLLDAAGVAAPDDPVFAGRSLLPLARGDSASDEGDDPAAFGEGTFVGRAVAQADARLAPFLTPDGRRPAFKWVRTARYALTVRATWLPGQGDDPAGLLFDLDADPHERANLFADPAHAATRDALLSRLRTWDAGTDTAHAASPHRVPTTELSRTPWPGGAGDARPARGHARGAGRWRAR